LKKNSQTLALAKSGWTSVSKPALRRRQALGNLRQNVANPKPKPKRQVRHAGTLGTASRRGFFFHPLLVVGWRIKYIKRAARTDPDGSAENYFERYQWMAIVMFVTKTRPDPAQPPSMSKFKSLIAQLSVTSTKNPKGPQVRSQSGVG